MKAKNFVWLATAVAGVVALAAGVAVAADKLLKKKNDACEGYIESDCTPEEAITTDAE